MLEIQHIRLGVSFTVIIWMWLGRSMYIPDEEEESWRRGSDISGVVCRQCSSEKNVS